MKKLSKLQINSEKLMNNEELMTLRGGYGGLVACACKKDKQILCDTQMVNNCGVGYDSCQQWCNYYCPQYEEIICVGD
jgi:hypothetical protein